MIERSDTMTAEDVEELMRKKINESFQVQLEQVIILYII